MKFGFDNVEPVNHWRECIHRNLVEDGYVVSASEDGCAIGEIIGDEFGIGMRFRVVGEATYADAMRQVKRSAAISGDEMIGPQATWHFYKTLPLGAGA